MTWDRERSTLQDCKLLEGSYPTERGWWKVEAIKCWTLSLSLNFQSAAAGLFICDLNTAKVALSNTCATFMVSVSSVTKHLFSFDFPLHTSYSKIGSSLYNTNLGGGYNRRLKTWQNKSLWYSYKRANRSVEFFTNKTQKHSLAPAENLEQIINTGK